MEMSEQHANALVRSAAISAHFELASEIWEAFFAGRISSRIRDLSLAPGRAELRALGPREG